MSKQPTCKCLQEVATHECQEVDFFYDQNGTVEIECCFYNETADRQEDVDLEWNFCPQCGAEILEVSK